jgi:hypothetical protein
VEPVLPDEPVEESEFDLDVRLQAVPRHVSADQGQQNSPDGGATCMVASYCMGC